MTMIELKKIKGIRDSHNPNRIIKKLVPSFNINMDFSEPYNYNHKIENINPKLRLHKNSLQELDNSLNVNKNYHETLNLAINSEKYRNKLQEQISNTDEKNTDVLMNILNEQLDKIEEEKPFLESFSFLDDKPKVNRIPIENLKVSHLYAKIDEIENKTKTAKHIQTEYINQNKKSKLISALIEEIDIPEVLSIKDDTKISQVITPDYFSSELQNIPKKEITPTVIVKDNKIITNPVIEDKIKNTISKSKTQKEEQRKKEAITDENEINYILPIDSKANTQSPVKLIETEKNKAFSKTKDLIYNVKPKTLSIDRNSISEKYSIDEFTFINIYYVENKGLVYNIIQPELTSAQEEIYFEIKKTFLDSIDSNYLSFRGDKQTIDNYIQKIYDLTIDKLSYDLDNLEKKLYLNFIKREFSGFGFLLNILADKNIIEVSCSGADLPLVVYHLVYGALETNLKFKSIFELNQYVLSLTKIMGLQVNSAQPIINGHLPNGYVVEGLYSVGDISNKGSSFIIKKYLDSPLTPVTLINLGIGTTDIYSYLWSAISENYQLLMVGEDNTIIQSALAQFYPDKKIISVQSYDYLKLPQKNWIKKLILDNSNISKKTIISQALSERPDYIILDNFTPDLFDIKWYDLNLFYIDKVLLREYLEKSRTLDLKLVIINFERIKADNLEQMQITNITEISNNLENKVIEYLKSDSEFHINLISSNINIIDFSNHKKLLRWLIDSDITDSRDFNNIITDYYNDKKRLLTKLNIQ